MQWLEDITLTASRARARLQQPWASKDLSMRLLRAVLHPFSLEFPSGT